jgi:predicted nucleotidyltransferase
MKGVQILTQHYPDMALLCQKHKVKTLYAFGSVLKDTFTDQSDIDFLVRFAHQEYGQDYLDLKDELEVLFNRNIDLLTVGQLKNPYFIEEINKTAQVVYE